MDQGQLDALYQQYLGRGVDPSGAATWGNADYQTVVNGILGSQEYQNRQQPQQQQQSAPQQSGGGTDINSIYQQYLGRNVDPSGAATYAGWDPQSIINAITSSQEYANRGGSANGVSPVAGPIPASEAPSWLRPEDYTANGYAAPYTQQEVSGKIDPSWYRPASGGVTYASVRGPSDLSGGEFVINPNTGTFAKDQNGNLIPVPRPNDPNKFGDFWADTAIPVGIALGAAMTGAGAAGLLGEGAALGSMGTDAALMGPTYGELGYTGLEAGMMGPTYAELGYTGLNGAEAIAAADAAAAAAAGSGLSGLSASTIANLLKGGASLASISKALGGTSGSSGSTGTTGTSVNPNSLANALKGLATPATTQTGTNFGLMKGNVNPFAYTKDVPTQTLAASKADPFAALNVAQTPVQPFNPLAHLVG